MLRLPLLDADFGVPVASPPRLGRRLHAGESADRAVDAGTEQGDDILDLFIRINYRR